MFKQVITGLALMAVVAGMAVNFAHAQENSVIEQTIETQKVWDHHIQAWGERDLDGIASDYDAQSLLIVNGRTYIGREQIKSVFSRLFSIFEDGHNMIDAPVIKDRLVYITWHFTPTNASEYFGTDTFIIEDGKIVVQTIASPLYEAYSEKR